MADGGGDGAAREAQRAALRERATGPCKDACLLVGDMAYRAFRAQLQANIDDARRSASDRFYDDPKLRRLDDAAREKAVGQFEAQLEQQLGAQLSKHNKSAHEWGMASVTRCMEVCVGKRDAEAAAELCACVEAAPDLPAASRCLGQQSP